MAIDEQVLRDIYRKRKQRGKQNLRFCLLLFTLFLVLYTALGFFVLETALQSTIYQGDEWNFLWKTIVELLVWLFVVWLLWHYNRLGRLLFIGCAGVSIYLCKDIVVFLQDSLITNVLYQYIFIGLVIMKCCCMLYCSGYLMFNPAVCSLWNMDDMFDQELAEMDQVDQDTTTPKAASMLASKGQRQVRRFTLRLAILLYMYVFAVLLILIMLSASLEANNSWTYLQRTSFSISLFSGLIWMVPITALLLYKKWALYLIYFAYGAEIIRLLLSYSIYYDLFTNISVASYAKVFFVFVEIIRYVILYTYSRKILKSKLIRRFFEVEQNE